MKSAVGMVLATAKVPHGLPFSAFTTTSASTASRITEIRMMPIPTTPPAVAPISVRIISPSDLPSRRVEKNNTTMSWTAPANTTPARIQSVPGR